MTQNSTIEWTDHSWSPWIGCTPVSAACDGCYAAAWAHRYGRAEYRAGAPRVRTSTAYWRDPVKWNRQAEANGVRPKVFPSLCDPFDAEVDRAWLIDFVQLIRDTPHLIWLLLTKRPNLALKLWEELRMPANAWAGTTVENQPMADQRLPLLLQIPAPRIFLSMEPLLGLTDVSWALSRNPLDIAAGFLKRGHFAPGLETLRPIDGVIAGGKSGPTATPSHPAWFRSLRDQCAAAGTPFFFKQWGEFVDATDDDQLRAKAPSDLIILPTGQTIGAGARVNGRLMGTVDEDWRAKGGAWMSRVGKKNAGALLDGREHREFPQ